MKSKVSHSLGEPEGGLYNRSLLYVAWKFCTGSVGLSLHIINKTGQMVKIQNVN
jgi:hypothetical protein